MSFGGKRTELEPLAGHHNGETATTIVLTDTSKSIKETSCYLLLVKVSAIPFRSRDDRFSRHIGVNFTFGLLDCDHYIGDIVIPWIVKPGFCSIHYTVTLARLKNVNHYIGNIVLLKIVISGFHCSNVSTINVSY